MSIKSMSNSVRYLLMFALIGFSISITSARAVEQSLTLQVAIQKTLLQNPQLHQFNAVRDRLIAERHISGLKPGYELGMELDNVLGTGENQAFKNTELTVALSSAIELGNKRQSRVSIVNAKLDEHETKKQAQTLDVLGQVTNTFILVLTTQEELRLSIEEVSLAKKLLQTIQLRAKRGAVSNAEVMRAKAMLARAELRQKNINSKFARQKIALARYWGVTRPGFSSVEGNLYNFGDPVSFHELYEKVKASPAINIFASEMRLKEAEMQLTKSQSQANVNWQLGIKRLQESNDFAFTAGFSIPLFAERRNQNKIAAELAQNNTIAFERQDRLLALHAQLYNAYSLRQQFITTYKTLKEQILPDLEKALSITRDAYNRGRLKYQDWIGAQQELLNTKQQMIDAASSALLNQAVIEQLTAEALTK